MDASPTIDPALLGAPNVDDPLFPGLGNGGYDVEAYDVRLRYEPESGMLDVDVRIRARATQGLARFSLDYGGLAAQDVRLVEVEGGPVPWQQASRKLTIDTPNVIDIGAPFEVHIAIAGVPVPTSSGGGLRGWVRLDEEQVMALGLFEATSQWLPSNGFVGDTAAMDIWIDVPKPFVAVAMGGLRGIEEQADRRIYQWASPTAGGVVTLAIREYDVVDLGAMAGVPVTGYFVPDSRARAEGLDELPAILELLTRCCGPYPFEGLSFVEVATDAAVPGEGILLWNDRYVDSVQLTHALTHLWFGENAPPAASIESFVRTAFANYGDLLWHEHAAGAQARDEVIRRWYDRLPAETDPPAAPTDISGPGFEALFARGPLALHALRVEIGNDAFFAMLREWTARFRGRSTTVADFEALAEEVSGRDLDDLFRRWLHQRPLPPPSDLAVTPAPSG